MKIQVSKEFLVFGKQNFKITDWTLNSKPVINLETATKGIDKIVMEFSGGGIKGVLGCYLNYVMFSSDNNLNVAMEKTKEVWGCSTGAIMAALWMLGVAKQKNLDKLPWVEQNWLGFKAILEWYIESGAKVFQKNFMGGGVWTSTYDSGPIEKLLHDNFKNLTMKQLYDLTGITLNIRVVNVTHNRPEIINHEDSPDFEVWAAVRASMSAPTYFPVFEYRGERYIDGGTGAFGVNALPAYYRCVEDLRWNPTEFFLLSWGCGRAKFGKIDSGKLSSISYFLTYSREESEISTNQELDDLVRIEGLRHYRWNIELPNELTGMDETNNINELVALVDR